MKDIQALKDFLAASRKIVIVTHANPDADALGSALGLFHFLKKAGHEVSPIVPNSYPEFLDWMPGNQEVINFEKKTEQSSDLIANSDLLFCLDFSGLNRIKAMSNAVSDTPAKIVLVDHHLNPEIKPDFNFWNDTAVATAELVFDLISELSVKVSINKEIAECLYAGIMTDTGSFRHPSTSSKVHRIVADLIDLGVDVNKISRFIYDTNSLNRLKFLGYSLAEKLQVCEQYQLAYFVIAGSDLRKFDLKQGDTEGLVNYALSIKGIVIAAVIIERSGEIRLSFRSVGDYSVNTFAEAYFQGGGHKNAAGGNSEKSLKETEKMFIELIKQNVLNTKIE